MQGCQHYCNISFGVQNNTFKSIMPSKIMCVVSINNGQPCLQTVIAVSDHEYWRGIRGTQVEPYIQDIVDEVAPIKEAPLWG